MRRYNAGSSCGKCTGVLQPYVPGVLVCSRNGTHFFEENPEQTPTKARPKKGHWPKPVRTVVLRGDEP